MQASALFHQHDPASPWIPRLCTFLLTHSKPTCHDFCFRPATTSGPMRCVSPSEQGVKMMLGRLRMPPGGKVFDVFVQSSNIAFGVQTSSNMWSSCWNSILCRFRSTNKKLTPGHPRSGKNRPKERGPMLKDKSTMIEGDI